MKIIKVDTDLKLTVHEYPEGGYDVTHPFLTGLIGKDCELVEHVLPRGLYEKLGMSRDLDSHKMVGMLIDEMGWYHSLSPNELASKLYNPNWTVNSLPIPGRAIVGNVLFVGEDYIGMGVDFCGINEEVFEDLKSKLETMICQLEGEW